MRISICQDTDVEQNDTSSHITRILEARFVVAMDLTKGPAHEALVELVHEVLGMTERDACEQG